ncbi:DUF3718 domain-containing protein [Glaciecola sp. XM2]|jgi:hypothetical protein|uniref:DUF3718 domain-containing protein n=1 Tax=Glaciecola sp. XM2 TaxID=1914931 RepID=UPI001BDF0B2F|nr:DUF3718 domain-containing protein [Glaciecola sp. XM2]MBT1449426.1 DUF3718 domain-containing protein [Glaciecola sp. XM2]
MLKKILMPLFVAAPLMMSATASSNEIETALANICDIVKTDDKGELRKKMKSVRSNFNLQLHDYYSGITCNGTSLIKLAIMNNSVEAGTLLVKKMPKKLLAEPEQDGKTLQAWIDEQGVGDNPVAVELLDRI